jgi:DNA-binding LacI/PurR family transcriptional regulator
METTQAIAKAIGCSPQTASKAINTDGSCQPPSLTSYNTFL